MADSLQALSSLVTSVPRSVVAPDEKPAVLEELHRILESPTFHSSPRCQEFLRYIVERTVEGSAELLKERNIGVDVFHRRPSYEPNVDSIVRVRATEVRKRLSQYYDHDAAGPSVRIALAAGSYVPVFHWASAATAPHELTETSPLVISPRVSRWKLRLWLATPAAGLLLLACILYLQMRTPASPLRDFWQPSLNGANPVVICLGQPVVYHLSRRLHEKYLATLPADHRPGPYVIPLTPGDIGASDILPVPDQYVGAGGAQATARLSALLAGWKKPVQVRVGNDFSFYDLRNHAAVLEGAFSNYWAMKLSESMPFVFIQENGIRGIRERAVPQNTWYLRSLQSDGKTSEDYATVARLFDSGTMEPLVFVAGITQYGTQAAGEFIADEPGFAAAVRKAPRDWRTRNIQILLHLNVIGKVPGKPEVLAFRSW